MALSSSSSSDHNHVSSSATVNFIIPNANTLDSVIHDSITQDLVTLETLVIHNPAINLAILDLVILDSDAEINDPTFEDTEDGNGSGMEYEDPNTSWRSS